MTPTFPTSLPVPSDIAQARRRLAPHVHRTPLLSSRSLGKVHGARVWLKPENLQRAGAFKIRGALNALLCARDRGVLGAAGVLTFSSGNHGQAVALAAQIVGTRAVVVVPETIPGVKRSAIETYGASVVVAGRTSEDRHRRALEIERETGAYLVPPYDHPDVIAGQGTVALEILEDLPGTGVILAPVGGGGLLSGVALGANTSPTPPEVVGAEPEGADDTARSLARGERVRLATTDSVADGLRALAPGELTFEIVRRLVRRIWCVSDREILEAQRLLLERAKLLTEPSGATGVAAYLRHGTALAGQEVVIVLSGGNADLPAAWGIQE